MNQIIKHRLIVYGIFIGIIVAFISLLVPLSLGSQKSRIRVFEKNVQSVLDSRVDENNKSLKIVSNIKIFSSFSTRGVAFSLDKKDNYAFLVRIETLFGPKCAVFLKDENNNVDFLGYAISQGKVEPALSSYDNDINILHWKRKIQTINVAGGKNE